MEQNGGVWAHNGRAPGRPPPLSTKGGGRPGERRLDFFFGSRVLWGGSWRAAQKPSGWGKKEADTHTRQEELGAAERWRTPPAREAVGRERERGGGGGSRVGRAGEGGGGAKSRRAARTRGWMVGCASKGGRFAPLPSRVPPRPPRAAALALPHRLPSRFRVSPPPPPARRPALVAPRPKGCKAATVRVFVENLAASRPPPHQRTGRVNEKGAGLVCLLFLVERREREQYSRENRASRGARGGSQTNKRAPCVPLRAPRRRERGCARALTGGPGSSSSSSSSCCCCCCCVCWVVLCVCGGFFARARALCGFFFFGCSPERVAKAAPLSLLSPQVHALSLSLSSDSGGSIDRWGGM